MYKFSVYYQTIANGSVKSEEFLSCLRHLLPDSGYVICPGISSYPSGIRFKTKHLHEWGEPFNHLDSDTCELWHIPNNSKQMPSSVLYNACKSCKQLCHDIQQLVKQDSTITDAQRQSRTMSSSNYGFQYLSPNSQQQRVFHISQEKRIFQVKLHSLEPYNCELSDEQHSEMLELVKTVNKNKKAVNELCKRGDDILGGTENNLLCAAWHQDVTERLEYEKDQATSGNAIVIFLYTAITIFLLFSNW